MRRAKLAAASLACTLLTAGALVTAVPAGADTAPSPGPTVGPVPADPFGPVPNPGSVVPGAGSASAVGQVTGAVVSPLFDRLRLAAAYVIDAERVAVSPRGATGAAADGPAWQPPADLRAPKVVDVPADPNGPVALTKDQILWAAYSSAAASVPASCRMPVTLLAAIGEVESSSLRGRMLDAQHDVVPPVVGPALNGRGFASVRDSDGGRYDGDPVWDRAVGPMQFIPASWRALGVDANGDGVADPQNIEDATFSAALYLCSGGKDLSRPGDLSRAVLSYNNSQRYLATVTGLMNAMTSGADAAP